MRTSSIRLRANARLAILHEDFLEICDGNMLAAMLLSILVYWTDVKISKKDENLWVWKSHQDFQEDLMFDKPGMKPPHRTTIKTALDILISKKFVEWRRNPKLPLDQTRQYLVDVKAVQRAIDKLPSIVVKPTMQSQNTDNAVSNNQQSLSENRHSNVEIPTSNTNDYNTEITHSEITESTNVATSHEDRNAPAAIIHDFEEWKEKTDKHKAVSPSHSQVDIRNETTSTSGAPSPSLSQTPAQPSGSLSTGSHASTEAVQEGKKPKRIRKPVEPDEQPTPKCDTKEIQRRINEHRGFALEERGQILQERIAIKTWCNLHTLEDYERVMAVLKDDPYWGKQENYYRIGGVTLAKETPKALAQKPKKDADKLGNYYYFSEAM